MNLQDLNSADISVEMVRQPDQEYQIFMPCLSVELTLVVKTDIFND